MMQTARTAFSKEIELERKLRKTKGLIPAIGLLTATVLYAVWMLCMNGFEADHFWTVIPAAFVLHAFMIVTVHDGAHRAITRGPADDLIMNLAAAMVLLPFYAELFRRYHIIHHSYTNRTVDPLWPPKKKRLFERSRKLFVLSEFIPLVNTLISLIIGSRQRQGLVKGPKVRIWYIVLATVVSVFVFLWLNIDLTFVIVTLLLTSLIAKVRNWCEHTGRDLSKESNTYWFPLGMGIGNHEAHHSLPQISWLVNQWCLMRKPRDTTPLKTLWNMLFDHSWIHYRAK